MSVATVAVLYSDEMGVIYPEAIVADFVVQAGESVSKTDVVTVVNPGYIKKAYSSYPIGVANKSMVEQGRCPVILRGVAKGFSNLGVRNVYYLDKSTNQLTVNPNLGPRVGYGISHTELLVDPEIST